MGRDDPLALVELEITRLLQGAPSIEAVAEDILRTLCLDLHWDLAELWLLDADSGLTRRTATWHKADLDVSEFDALTQGVAVARGFGVPGRVLSGGEAIWVKDIASDPIVIRREEAARAGLACAVAFPVVDGRETTGIVGLLRRQPMEPDNGMTAALVAIGRRIGEFVRVEQALRRGGAHFRAMVENMADIVALVDLDGIIHYENAAVTRILGYDRRERLGKNAYEFMHPEDLPKAQAAFRRALDDPGSDQFLRVRVRHKDGSWRLIESTGRVMVDSTGKQVALFSARDVGDRMHRSAGPEAGTPAANPGPVLTEREVETLRLVARGMSNKQIAEVSGVSPYTVKDRLQAAMRKLGTNSRAEAAAIATRRGLI